MVGFNLPSPIPQLTAEQIAQLGLAGFKPPGPMSVPGMSMPQAQQAPGFNLGDGMSALGAGIGTLGKVGGVANAGPQGSGEGGMYTPADAMSMAGMGGDPMAPGYGAPADLGIKTPQLDPLTNMVNWIGRQFRPGGS